MAGICLGAFVFLTGCAPIGPNTVVRDRIDYTQALADSWKEQMLLNIVKIRYGDTPIFLDVVSVINSYEVSGSADLGASLGFQPTYQSSASLGGRGFFANRPTITYTPLSGEKFAKSLMTPIPPLAIMHLIQAGYPADLVFQLLVQSINGVKNRYGGGLTLHSGDARFWELGERLKRIQVNGALGLKAPSRDGQDFRIIVFGGTSGDDTLADVAAVKDILGLDPRADEFTVTYGMLQTDKQEIAILTRSVLQILSHLAAFIDVPEDHIRDGRAGPTYRNEHGAGETSSALIRIHSASDHPGNVFFTVPYQGYWFWIDDTDLISKKIFSFLMFVFTLVETGAKDGAPVVTIPVR